MVPEGWEVADATQLSYGQALLTKVTPEGAEPPNDTSVSTRATCERERRVNASGV